LLGTGRTLFERYHQKARNLRITTSAAHSERVLAFMLETERDLFKLGIPAKTRHNEVGPGQFELAPVFENANLATDHQQMTMVRSGAWPRNMARCLLHEKPFAGVNGSVQACELLDRQRCDPRQFCSDPGDTLHANAQFLVSLRGGHCAVQVRAACYARSWPPPPMTIASANEAASDHLGLPGIMPLGHLRSRERRSQEYKK
jgi:glutamine synthetase